MRNLISHNYIIDASCELTPTIRIAPFGNTYLQKNRTQCSGLKLVDYLNLRFENYCVLPKGRSAISVALSLLGLSKGDVVTVLTTSGNFYISGCVTKEIEKYCDWSRELTNNTKAIFVNHEFGYPYKNLSSLRKYGVPIIEDCAHSFLSDDGKIGRVGDYVIYSLPKCFPVQLGGIIASQHRKIDIKEDRDLTDYLFPALSDYVAQIPDIRQKRLNNYHILEKRLSVLGITPFFPLEEGVIPGVFLFRWLDSIDYPALKVFMQANGVECSVFYGENGFFIPCHQNLTKAEIEYMCELLSFFYNEHFK